MPHQSHLSGRTGPVVLACGIGLAITLACYFVQDPIFQAVASLNGTATDLVTAETSKTDIWTRLSLNLLKKGPIPYAILCVFVSCLAYVLLAVLMKLWPSPRTATRDAQKLDDALTQAEGDTRQGMEDAIDDIPERTELGHRLREVVRAYEASGRPSDAQEANDRLGALAEVRTQLRIHPLVYGEWMLPVLGFLGTVWGVILAVTDLRSGITELFSKGDLTSEALQSFSNGFNGLGLAFFTTLYGLAGLATIGTIAFFLRRRVARALMIVDEACRRALIALPEHEDLFTLIRTGFFVTDENNQLVRDEDGKPQLRFSEWMRELREGFFVTDDDGNLIRGEDGKPKHRFEEWLDIMRRGLFQTDDEGALVLGSDGAPIDRAREWREVIRTGFFITDGTGELVVGEDGKPIPRWQGFFEKSNACQQLMAWLLVQEFLEVTGDEARQIATGTVEDVDGSKEVMLSNRNERRFRQLVGELHFIEAQLEKHSASPATADEPPVSGRGYRVLAPTGGPVHSVAAEAGRFAIARETGNQTNDYAVWLGTIEEKVEGKYLVPVVNGEEPVPEPPEGLALSADRLVCTFPGRKTLEAYGLLKNLGEAEVVFDRGTLHPRSLVTVQHEGVDHAMVLLGLEDTHEVHAWRLDGTAPPDQTDVLGIAEGSPTAVAPRTRFGLATASPNGSGSVITQIKGGELCKHQVDHAVSAMGYAPHGSLYYVSSAGELVELSMHHQNPVPNRIRTVVPDHGYELLVVTAAEEVILCTPGGKQLVVIPLATDVEQTTIEYHCQITAVTASVDGRCLLVGLEDGSAYFLDGRRSLVR